MKNENYKNEEREINNILLVGIPIAIITAISIILWLAFHFQNMN